MSKPNLASVYLNSAFMLHRKSPVTDLFIRVDECRPQTYSLFTRSLATSHSLTMPHFTKTGFCNVNGRGSWSCEWTFNMFPRRRRVSIFHKLRTSNLVTHAANVQCSHLPSHYYLRLAGVKNNVIWKCECIRTRLRIQCFLPRMF